MKNKFSYKTRLNIYLVAYSSAITLFIFLVSFLFIPRVQLSQSKVSSDVFIHSTTTEIVDNMQRGLTISPTQLSEKVVTANELKGIYGKEITKNLLLIFIIVFTLVIVLSSLLVKIVSKKALSPFEKLTNTLENISFNKNEEINKEDIFIGELEDVKDIFNSHVNKIDTLMKEASTLNSYIAHEQKNSLAILRGKIQLKEYEEALPVIDSIVSSLDDILALNATYDIKEIEIVDLGLVVARSIDLYSNIHSHIKFQLDEENSLLTKGKDSLIFRGVCNLIENAIKYGGKEILVSVYNKNNSVIISVNDNGYGINIEKIDKIFNYRYRGEHLKKDGYGIGLSLVNHVVQLFNGVVWAESEKGNGSTFYMCFKSLTLD